MYTYGFTMLHNDPNLSEGKEENKFICHLKAGKAFFYENFDQLETDKKNVLVRLRFTHCVFRNNTLCYDKFWIWPLQ